MIMGTLSAPWVWTRSQPLILASTSTTRRQLLINAGLMVECQASGIDERSIEAKLQDQSPSDLACSLARAKTLAVAEQHKRHVVVGADQVLSCEGTIFHKIRNLDEAHAQIAQLSGRTHSLHSAVAIAEGGTIVDSFVDEARLTMRHLDSVAIDRYVETAGLDRVTTSVGGYQLEGLGIHLFSRIEGDHSTILGLPLTALLERLRARDCLAF